MNFVEALLGQRWLQEKASPAEALEINLVEALVELEEKLNFAETLKLLEALEVEFAETLVSLSEDARCEEALIKLGIVGQVELAKSPRFKVDRDVEPAKTLAATKFGMWELRILNPEVSETELHDEIALRKSACPRHRGLEVAIGSNPRPRESGGLTS